MSISVFDLFSIGVGPSSSHTTGPMRAGFAFVQTLQTQNKLGKVRALTVELFGSLALTGKGHGTDKAILMGLSGETPQDIDPDNIPTLIKHIQATQQLTLLKHQTIGFDLTTDLVFHTDERLPYHTNGMRFTARDSANKIVQQSIYYSIGGGFIVSDQEIQEKADTQNDAIKPTKPDIPYPFKNANELFLHCHHNQLKIHEVMLANEKIWRSEKEIYCQLWKLYKIMQTAIRRGCKTPGTLPGGLKISRRASKLFKALKSKQRFSFRRVPDMQWLDVFALAVAEENASGGRIITAPTNGSAGVIPAVLHYYKKFHRGVRKKHVAHFLLTAGAIALLYKQGASISGAEVGCQGEIGVACSMAAGAFTAALGGQLEQIETAATSAMEHHLGLTCDPINGLVQIPCIERNAIAAVTAVNVTNLSLLEYKTFHVVTLDNVIATMKQTGLDMNTKYKETSLGGLATHYTAC